MDPIREYIHEVLVHMFYYITWFSNMGTRRATGRAGENSAEFPDLALWEPSNFLSESEVTMRSSGTAHGGPFRTWHSGDLIWTNQRRWRYHLVANIPRIVSG